MFKISPKTIFLLLLLVGLSYVVESYTAYQAKRNTQSAQISPAKQQQITELLETIKKVDPTTHQSLMKIMNDKKQSQSYKDTAIFGAFQQLTQTHFNKIANDKYREMLKIDVAIYKNILDKDPSGELCSTVLLQENPAKIIEASNLIAEELMFQKLNALNQALLSTFNPQNPTFTTDEKIAFANQSALTEIAKFPGIADDLEALSVKDIQNKPRYCQFHMSWITSIIESPEPDLAIESFKHLILSE